MPTAAMFLHVCAGVGEDKHELLELVCCLHGECVHVPLVFVSMYVCVFLQLCCFLLFPTASPNLSRLPLSSAEFTTSSPADICVRFKQGQTGRYSRRSRLYNTTKYIL